MQSIGKTLFKYDLDFLPSSDYPKYCSNGKDPR